ncbi:MAG TPA: hypothetical protein VMF07_13880 [Solirubrobacteraceae bacterium]|nr:hypothetical protein [Solirubrobacteraceae bacterium]
MTPHKDEKPEAGAAPIRWREDVAEHDYGAAQSYLSLRYDDGRASTVVGRLREAELTTRRVNDVLRATRLDPAPLDDPGVLKDLIKVIEGKALSPVLLVRGVDRTEVADGFHRLSLLYRIDPYGQVPLRLADAGP